jgi:hypothetical protein
MFWWNSAVFRRIDKVFLLNKTPCKGTFLNKLFHIWVCAICYSVLESKSVGGDNAPPSSYPPGSGERESGDKQDTLLIVRTRPVDFMPCGLKIYALPPSKLPFIKESASLEHLTMLICLKCDLTFDSYLLEPSLSFFISDYRENGLAN